jgi:hypothetical protein
MVRRVLFGPKGFAVSIWFGTDFNNHEDRMFEYCLNVGGVSHPTTPESSEFNAHINSCEHFQHIKTPTELAPDSTETINTTQRITYI